MFKIASIMIGTMQPKEMRAFYEKVFGKAPEMTDGDWAGWTAGGVFFTIGSHSEMKGQTKEPGRIMFNFESTDVKADFAKLVALGAKEVAAPYEMGGMWIATLGDPDGNLFQLMPPWEAGK